MSSFRLRHLAATTLRAPEATLKLATRFFFPKVIAMADVHFLPPPGWAKARLYHLLAPLVALALVGLFEQTWLGEFLEDQTVNLRFRTRAPFDPPADPRLVFVTIDEFSLHTLGRWPWPRSVEADFLKSIAYAGVNPHTVAFDVMFTEDSGKRHEDDGSVRDDDAAFGDAAALLPSVITGASSVQKADDPAEASFDEKRTQEALSELGPTQPLTNIRGDIKDLPGSDAADFPVKAIRTQSLIGFVNDNPSPIDGIRHSLPLLIRVKDKVFPSLALQTLCQMLGVDADKVEVDLPSRFVRLKNSSGKNWNIPTNEKGEFFINYRNQSKFLSISFAALTQNLIDHTKNGTPIAPDCNIDNKALVVGESATALGDMGPSPLAARSPLPYAHLNAINSVLKNDYLSFIPWYEVVAGWLLTTWVTLLRLKDAPLVEAVGMPIVTMIAYVIFAFGIFWLWSVQIALAWPVLTYVVVNFGAVVLRWREEQKGRQQIKQLFARMVSPEIMNHLLAHPENMKLGGSDRASTVLFSDIRDYTKFSEGLDAAEVVRQLNIYFERMVGCVTDCKGTFHKFIGDAIMAAWGDIAAASFGPEHDACNAVRSALMMRGRLRELNAEREAEGMISLRIGIGLNHGVVQAGMLGSTGRMEFTVMGDGVNTASRLEGMTKEFKTDLAVSESVQQLLGADFLVRRLGLIVLKGKTTPTVVYEVLAEKSDMSTSRMSVGGVAQYEEAFDHFLARRFEKAIAGFESCEKNYPDDYCVKSYLQASREFSSTPPPADWDGRIVMTTK